ncbi:reverse transcriptase domain-containing protein [Tanacetum coccineum]
MIPINNSLNAAAGGNLLSKTIREALNIIKNKSKVRYSRNKSNVSRMNTTSSSKTDERIDKLADQISTLVEIVSKKVVTPATVKAVEESYVICGNAHACGFFQNQASTSGTLLSNTIPNPKGEMKAITTRSGVAYEGPLIPTKPSLKKIVERETEETKDKEQNVPVHIQPLVNPIPISEPDVLKSLPKPNIPYPSRLNDQKLREKASNQMEKIFQIFQDLRFDISFADALLLMPKFVSTIKSLLINKDKLFELAKIPLNENCLAMLLKKLPEKLRDPDKFLIPCNFPGMNKKLSLTELTPTRITFELADRSITHPKGVAEDVFVKVGKFHFPTDFVVVDFEADPQVPLILGRSFLRTGRALIDVYREEITLRVNDEAVAFNLNQTRRYSSTYDDMSVNRIDIIDVSREEYAQDVLGFLNNNSGGNPTPMFEPIIFDSSPSLTPFEGSDFILEEIEAYLKDDSISPEIDYADLEVTKAKSSIEEPLELELKDLPSHLEYVYLEGTDKLPVIIAKGLKDDEKEALLKVLKSHKRAIAWKITDIKGIDPRFCTHKILMEEDYKPTVQRQRRVNPKIHEVIKKEVFKLLDAGMIYSIFDSPWVSPVHCVPKKGGITVVANEDNELIPTRLVTGWRVCFDYRKLNEATRKDHFPLPFMDQMLERLAENEFYCFLDGFSRPMTHLLEKETPFVFSKDCIDAFETLKKKLTEAPILVVPDWNLPFELMCDASDFAIGAVLGQQVKALPTNDARVVVKFLKSLFARFGTPRAIISDRGTHFCNDKFAKVMSKYGVTHRLANTYHPQMSGQVEVFNRGLKRILERTVGENHTSWSDKLDDALWAFRTAFKTPIGCTLYKLVYGKACHLPIELEHKAYWALKHVNFDLKTAGDHRKVQLHELNELWDQAYENSFIYKEKTKKIHDAGIKNYEFHVGDRVLLFNSRLKLFSGKLKTRWSGPFTITQVFPYGTIKLSQPDGPNFKVNGHRVKHYFGGDMPSKVVPDLQTVLIDN